MRGTVDVRVYSDFLGTSGFPNECGEERGRKKVERVEGTRAACKSVSPGSGGQFPRSPGVPVLNAGSLVGSRRKNGHRMKSAP